MTVETNEVTGYSAGDPCPDCGLVPGVELKLSDYEEFWAASPELGDALARNVQVHCNTCTRMLTFQIGGDAGFKFRPDGTHSKPSPSSGGPASGDPERVAELVTKAGKLLGRST